MAAPLSFDTVYRQIRRGEFAPVYYLTGVESVLKDELVSVVLDSVVDPSMRDFNFDSRGAGDVDAEGFTALVDTPPMLVDRRVVVIRNIEQWRKNSKVWHVVEQYVADPSPMTVLILTHTLGNKKPATSIAKCSCHVRVDTLSPDRLVRWVAMRAERAGAPVDAEGAQHLVAAVGTDLAQLGMELDKLAAASDGGAIDAARVAELVGVRRGETSNDWIEAVILRDGLRAAEMLPTVLASSGNTAVRLIGYAGSVLLVVRLARALLDTGVPPHRVESAVFGQFRTARLYALPNWKKAAADFTAAARLWTARELDLAIRAALTADRAIKSTTIADETAILIDMVLRMSLRKAAA
ncbi:MAG: DNA polymerase III subunit delta [Gemmatimonadales bacterium]|jgi:DNA polymerase-3 subunit delta